MRSLTEKEKETLLIVFKEFTSFYNAHTLSKTLHISHAGAQKMCKRLLQDHLLISRTIGKSIVYKPNFDEEYLDPLMVFLLVNEANDFRRWKEEFKELFKNDRIILLFGSTVKDYAHAQDIDILVTLENKEVKEINRILRKKEEILPKKIHAIKLTRQDFLENLKKKNKAMIDIVKNAIVLYGQEKYVEMLKSVTSL